MGERDIYGGLGITVLFSGEMKHMLGSDFDWCRCAQKLVDVMGIALDCDPQLLISVGNDTLSGKMTSSATSQKILPFLLFKKHCSRC